MNNLLEQALKDGLIDFDEEQGAKGEYWFEIKTHSGVCTHFIVTHREDDFYVMLMDFEANEGEHCEVVWYHGDCINKAMLAVNEVILTNKEEQFTGYEEKK